MIFRRKQKWQPRQQLATATEGPDSSDEQTGPDSEPILTSSPDTSVPLLIFLVVFFTFFPWLFGNFSIAGFKITGWSWIITLGVSTFLLGHTRRITFPVRYWIPWILIIIVHAFFADKHPSQYQTAAQMICPIIVGCAVSTLRINNTQLEKIIKLLVGLSLVSWIIITIKLPLLFMGKLPVHGQMTPEAITTSLLASIYAAFYACGYGRCLFHYFGMAAVPAILLTRGPMLGCFAAMPASFSPLGAGKRATMAFLLLLLGLGVFYTPRMQKIMFYSDQGDVSDLLQDNEDLDISGRRALWEALWENVHERPWLGHGLNASRTVLLEELRTPLYLPHNDWLRILHDMGIAGLSMHILAILFQLAGLLYLAKVLPKEGKMLAYAGATAFIPYCILMFTDNINLYVQFFGNLQFTLIGLSYAVRASIDDQAGVESDNNEQAIN